MYLKKGVCSLKKEHCSSRSRFSFLVSSTLAALYMFVHLIYFYKMRNFKHLITMCLSCLNQHALIKARTKLHQNKSGEIKCDVYIILLFTGSILIFVYILWCSFTNWLPVWLTFIRVHNKMVLYCNNRRKSKREIFFIVSCKLKNMFGWLRCYALSNIKFAVF